MTAPSEPTSRQARRAAMRSRTKEIGGLQRDLVRTEKQMRREMRKAKRGRKYHDVLGLVAGDGMPRTYTENELNAVANSARGELEAMERHAFGENRFVIRRPE